VRIAALCAYPVKSCGAVALEEAALGPLGFANDRRFAFVGADGRTLTQRDQPLLAAIRPQLDAHGLRLDLGGVAQVKVPLDAFGLQAASDFLGRPVRLVALEDGAKRAFVDAEPLLVVTIAALGALNSRLEAPVGIERFRANVVIEGARLREELQWRSLAGDEAILECLAPCERCEVTTIDQWSGARCGEEPLRSIKERFGGEFGIYCRVAHGGRLKRGESLRAQ
jgi:hypothetical protein